LRKRLVEGDLVAAPCHIGRQRVEIGIDGEMGGRVETAAERHDRPRWRSRGVAPGEFDDASDEASDHAAPRSFHLHGHCAAVMAELPRKFEPRHIADTLCVDAA
jgi:hypothetical protein